MAGKDFLPEAAITKEIIFSRSKRENFIGRTQLYNTVRQERHQPPLLGQASHHSIYKDSLIPAATMRSKTRAITLVTKVWCCGLPLQQIATITHRYTFTIK